MKDISLLIPFWGLVSYISDTNREENRAPILFVLLFYNFFVGYLVLELIGL